MQRIAAPRFRWATWAAAGLLLWAANASAQSKGDKGGGIAVIVEGSHAEEVAIGVEEQLATPDSLRNPKDLRSALRHRGFASLHPAATNATRDAQLIARVRAAAKDAHVDGAVLVDVQKTPRATHLHVWNIDNRHKGAVVDRDLTLPSTASAADETRAIVASLPASTTTDAQVRQGLAQSSEQHPEATPSGPGDAPSALGAPSANPASSAGTTDNNVAQTPTTSMPSNADKGPDAPPPDRTTSRRATSLFAAQPAFGVGMRNFSYVDRITPSLRPYNLTAAPLVSMAAEVFPFAPTHVFLLRDFGVTGDYTRAFGLSSEDSAGNHVGTTWQSYDVGATERIPVTRALLASVSGGYGVNDFQFAQSAPGAAAALPSVAYRFIRAGADLRFTFRQPFAVFGGGSYLDILSTGYSLVLFPRESVGGVEGHVGASYSFARNCELSLSLAYTRVFFSFNPVPGDANVAGGALDQQARLSAGFAYLM